LNPSNVTTATLIFFTSIYQPNAAAKVARISNYR